MCLEIKVEKAYHGDCIWIRFGKNEKSNIIVDSGPAMFTSKFKNMLEEIKSKNEKLDLLILTHIDNDHILGFKNYIQENDCDIIEKIWLNGDGVAAYTNNQLLSPKNVGKLVDEINAKSIELVSPIYEGHEETINGGHIKVIAPIQEAILEVAKLVDKFKLNSSKLVTKSLETLYLEDKYEEEKTVTNKASIAFVFEYKNKKIAFLGDAVATDIIDGFKKYYDGCKVDFVKIPHHGSKHNTSCELISILGADKFIISKNRNVDKETIARIVNTCEKAEIYCNYNWWECTNYFNKNDKEKYIDSGKLVIRENNLISIHNKE